MRLTERGFVSCIQTRTATPEVKCEGSSPRALALGGAAPAFILLAGGFLLSALIMLCERLEIFTTSIGDDIVVCLLCIIFWSCHSGFSVITR